jgi:hypothetical protein
MVTYDARPSGFNQLTTTTDWESFMSSAGIYDGIDGSNSLTPSLDTVGRNAVIGAGQALIKGQLWSCDAPVSVPIPAASSQNRLDRLVLRLNRTASTSPNVVSPVVITGTPSGSPVMPPLQQTPAGLWDIPISNWVSNSGGTLTNLSDQRQYSARSVISMQSTYHPSPPNVRLGLEVDTMKVYSWNGSVWSVLPGTSQTDANIRTNNNLSGPNTITAIYTIPANDLQVGTIYEIDMPWQCIMGGQTLTMGLSVDGATAYTISDTIGGAIVASGVGLNGQIKVGIQCQSIGASGTILGYLYGTIKQNGLNTLFTNSAVFNAAPVSSVAIDTTKSHNIRINSTWGAAASAQTLSAVGSRCTRLGP